MTKEFYIVSIGFRFMAPVIEAFPTYSSALDFFNYHGTSSVHPASLIKVMVSDTGVAQSLIEERNL